MKHIIEFNTKDMDQFDRCDYNQVLKASNMALALWDISNQMLRYTDDMTKSQNKLMEKLIDKFNDVLQNNDIDLDEVII